jgi:phage replication O-like protein O
LANELAMALIQSDLNATELKVVLFIIYQTYGYNKKSRCLSYKYISTGTHKPIDSVRRAVRSLLKQGVICQKNTNVNSIKELSVNKNYADWVFKNDPLKADIECSKMTPQNSVEGVKNDRSKMTRGGSKMTGQFCTEGGSNLPKSPYENDPQNKTDKTKQIKTIQSSSTTATATPKIEEIISYCQEKGYTFDSKKFFCHYQSLGWSYKGQPITDWTALADRWQITENQTGKKYQPVKTETKASYGIDQLESFSMFD